MKKILVLSALALALLSVTRLRAETSFSRKAVGTSAGQFLKMGVNARAVAMGEAYSAVADGSDAIFWNPAGLHRVENRAFSFMHSVYVQGIQHDFASYAQKIDALGTLGVSVQYMGAGELDETNASGAKVGSFRPYDMAATLGWGRLFKGFEGHEFAAGAALKMVRSKIVETAQTAAVDLGTQWSPYQDLWLALAVQNIGGQLKFKNEGDDLPLNVRLGSSYNVSWPLLLAADVNFSGDNNASASLGAEYKLRLGRESWASGRAGYSSRTASDLSGLPGVSAGCGLAGPSFGIDFAWTPFGDLGNAYRVSVSGKF
ncbi:MAG: hypothetical protein A3A86_05470 [Elusimicrobia bacterium RIFCSPLOWO2_01_FULL_60_11]|nr:MAG: hypothetical protein A3A86_05470 [Elusimicrobia bacterium RIFCSPLOWO2_01_FULL_60_11]